MGKRKSKSGLSGISQFLPALQKDQTNVRPELSPSGSPTKSTTRMEEDVYAGINCSEGTESGTPTVLGSLAHSKTKNQRTSRYSASGLVPFFSDASQVPEHLKKYFSQRKRYFSLYDKPPGCLLDEEGWYSITPERIADQIAERCRCDVVLDAFCGVGGNAIAFAQTCERVIALDTNLTRLTLARHNAAIYGVADRIEFIHADYISFARAYLSSLSRKKGRKIDVVFLSPPWGGPSYLSSATLSESGGIGAEDKVIHPAYSLSSVQPIHGRDLFSLTRKITPNIAYYLPRNTNLSEISNLLNDTDGRENSVRLQGEQVEVEEEWMGNKLKALTCYFGGLAAGQERLL